MVSGQTIKYITRNNVSYSAHGVMWECSAAHDPLRLTPCGRQGGMLPHPPSPPPLSSGDMSHEYMDERIYEHLSTYMKTGMRVCEHTYVHMHIHE